MQRIMSDAMMQPTNHVCFDIKIRLLSSWVVMVGIWDFAIQHGNILPMKLMSVSEHSDSGNNREGRQTITVFGMTPASASTPRDAIDR